MYPHARIVFILFSLVNILLLVTYGKKIAKAPISKYWNLAIIPIISYTLYMGLRFGRMVDFNVYCDRYYDLGRDVSSLDYEPLFRYICYFFNLLNIPYQGFIVFCAFMAIFTCCYWLKRWKEAMPIMFILFMHEAVNIENYVRWYLGIAFFLLYVASLNEGKKKSYLFFAICACLTHVGFVPLTVAVYFIRRIPFLLIKKVYIIQVLFILSVFMGGVQMLSFLNPYITILGVDDRSLSYTENFADLIEGEFGHVGFHYMRFTTQIRTILAYSFPLYMIQTLVNKDLIHKYEANIYMMAIVIAPLFAQVEILDRFASAFLLFSVPVTGVAYYYFWQNRKSYKLPMKVLFALSFISYIEPTFSNIVSRTEWYEMLFYWDANGRESLPLYYFTKDLVR